MWIRVNGTRWADRKSNAQVLNEITENSSLINKTEKRKIKLTGHLIITLFGMFSIGKVIGKKWEVN